MQNYAEFNGGGDGTEIQPNSERGMPLQKSRPCKKKPLYVTFVRVGASAFAELTRCRLAF